MRPVVTASQADLVFGCSSRGKVKSLSSSVSKVWLVVVFVLFLVVRVLTRHRRWVLRSSVSEGGGQ